MRTLCKAWFALLVVVVGLLMGTMAFADELAVFEMGRVSYTGGRYEQAAERFSEMLEPTNPDRLKSPDLVEQARIYRAAALIALGRVQEADKEIEEALQANSSAYPDPVIFPAPVVERFTNVRSRIRQQLEAQARERARQERLRFEKERERKEREKARIQKLEELAEQEVQVVQNSRWVAALPFGVGQFQNQQDALAWTLVLGETALATTSVVTAAIAMDIESRGNDPNVDTVALNERLDTLRTANQLSFAGFALLAVGGVIHAQLTYVPSRKEVKTRPLTDELRATPTVSAVEGGAVLGLGGTF